MKIRKGVLEEAKKAQANKFDIVFIITGRERRGKSMLLLHLLDDLGVQSLKGVLTLEGNEFHDIVHNAGFDQTVALDEAGEALFSRDSLKIQNKLLVKTFQTCGYKRLITFLVLPNFQFIDKYFRTHRIDGIFNVYERGKFNFFDRRRIEREIFRWKKIPIERTKSDSFTDYKGRLRAEYDEIKHNFVFNRQAHKRVITKKDVICWGLENGITQQRIAEFVGVTHPYISQIKNGTV